MVSEAKVSPAGVEHRIGPADLFFSTTDSRGVIRSGNSVFARVAQYRLDELTGAPHNLVRHPDMPAGAFRLMWDRLQAGLPMGAYVKNQARDGGYYWVFATITPLGEGYLSVRMSPQAALFGPARELYAEVAAVEGHASHVEGLDRRTVAGIGAAQLEQGLRRLGFAGYDDFLLAALPAEIAARGRLVAQTAPRTSGPMGDLVAASTALEQQLGALIDRLEAYRRLSEQLVAGAASVLAMTQRLAHAVIAAQHASQTVAETAPVLRNVATVMVSPMTSAVAALEQLAPRLRSLQTDIASLRFRIALAVLHNDMVAAFAAEAVAGSAAAASLAEVPLLCDAVHEGVTEMSRAAQTVDIDLRDVASLVGATGHLLDEFRRFLGQWRILVGRHRAAAALGPLLTPIDDEIAAGHDGIDMLHSLGERCRSAVLGLDAPALQAQVIRIRAAAAQAAQTA